jgi:glycosyltransferase involved in cell wall biosynthesis
MPLLSIITINLNNAAGLQKTVESVVSQTFADYEYIVIDGGSTDGSADVIKRHEDRIAYWTSEPDSGIYSAMNKGIRRAKGEYCLFLNSGDYLYECDVLSNICHKLKDVDIIYGNVMNFTLNGKQWLENPPQKVSLYSLGYKKSSLPHQAMFINKTLFDKYGGYDESLNMVSDWAFYLISIFRYNCSYLYIDRIISCYNKEGFSSNESNEPLQEKERASVMRKNFNALYPDLEQRHLLEISNNSAKALVKQLLKIIKRKFISILFKKNTV